MGVPASYKAYIKEEKEIPDKGIIVKEGAKGGFVFMILKGGAKVLKKSSKGMVTIDALKEGSIIGEMNMLSDTINVTTATVVADGPVKLGILDAKKLTEEIKAIPPELRQLIETFVLQLKDVTEKVTGKIGN